MAGPPGAGKGYFQGQLRKEAGPQYLTIAADEFKTRLNLRILENFATHVAPELGWIPNQAGPVTGYEITTG